MAGSPERNFSGALSTWKDIDLTSLQKTLDTQGLELVENQKESLVGRKALADKTKDFKKLSEEEKPNAFKTLLKAYQTEIDSLTKRSKASENAFLGVYKLLADAPDPYPLLEAAVDQTVKVSEAEALETELATVKEENIELKKRMNEVATLEASLKKAELRAETLEEKMESLIQERVSQKENELNATYDEKLLNYEERERDLQRQLNLTKEQIRGLRVSHETNQEKLLNQSEKQDQEVAARLAEMDMLAADLERANGRVAAVERRNELLRAEIEAVRSGSESEAQIKSLEKTISELEAEGQRLLGAVESQKDKTRVAEATAHRKAEESGKELSSKLVELETLKSRLRKYNDYDEIKRELDIMKYVEFGGSLDLDDDDDVQMPTPNANANGHADKSAKSLEALVHAKNKRLLEELTRLRISYSETEASLRAVTEALNRSRTDLDKQRALNERLETDLLQLNPIAPSSLPSTSRARSSSGVGTPSSNVNDPADALSNLNIGSGTPSKKDSAPISRDGTPIPFNANSSAETSILPIVTNQRDRFRQRNAELEEELRKQSEVVSDLRSDIKSLQQDNLKLYEKVRYIQSYREDDLSSSTVTPSGSRNQFVPSPSNAMPVARSNDEISKYKSMYEERMNPFEQFRGREQARAVQSLNPIERGVFILTRQILGNRRARVAFAFYAAALHMLVLITLYECSSFGAGGGTTKVAQPPSGVF